MAIAYKVLGQSAPSATTNTDLYTVPSNTQAIVSTIAISNRASGESNFRISIRPAGATLESKHYIAYDSPAPGNDTVFITVGFTLGATDVVTVRSSSADLSFSIYGSEVTT